MIPYGFNSPRLVASMDKPEQKMCWEAKVGCLFCGILCAGQIFMTLIMVMEKFGFK